MISINLITGFLGVGKTTAIQYLLSERPSDERWAVLVNEFGEIGIDGSLLSDEDVRIEEIPGGCLCCVSAPMFTIGLNKLIRQKPDRIIIEPSGLGHPAKIIETLTTPPYSSLLLLQATVCLVDPRHFSSTQHTEHPSFQDQIHLADVLVANKVDKASTHDRQEFEQFISTLNPQKKRIGWIENGQLPASWLATNSDHSQQALYPEAHAFLIDQQSENKKLPDNNWQAIEGYSDGFYQTSWSLSNELMFNQPILIEYLNQLDIMRIKGIFQSQGGGFSYNRSDDDADISTSKHKTNRLQLINPSAIDSRKIQNDLSVALIQSTL